MNIPDYETSLDTYLQHKKSKWIEDDNLFKKDLIEFMLSSEKKKIEQNCYYLPECLEKENIPMKFKKVTEEVTEKNIQVWWVEILENYKNKKYGMLSHLLLKCPEPLKIWKVKPNNYPYLRFCGADFCMGFINTDETESLEIDVVENDLLGNVEKMKYVLKPNEQTDFKKPLWFSKYPLKEFKLKASHHNFNILYVWIPHQILNTNDLPELTMKM